MPHARFSVNRADKFGCYTVTFINHSAATENEVWTLFKKVGTMLEVSRLILLSSSAT